MREMEVCKKNWKSRKKNVSLYKRWQDKYGEENAISKNVKKKML